ncbi:MAG: extracellular solute-binding protein [Gammaproteobacteria bacterium]|nr:extracellular solute-binding protein [Gammaproteobacteria bacterium]
MVVLVALTVLALTSPRTVHADDLTVWVIDGHAERPYFAQLAKAFNAKHAADGLTLRLESIPGYNDAIEVAWLGGDLPDVVMIDGPNMASYAWHGMLQPIGHLIDERTLAQLLPGVIEQGTYPPDQNIYMLAAGDSSVALWANRRHLERAGIDIPRTLADAWSYEQFTAVLEKLSHTEGVRWPLDFKTGYDGEWRSYGYYPLLRSGGGDIIDRRSWRAHGTLNSSTNVDTLARIMTWFERDYIVPASAGDNRFFGDRSAALSWTGNWVWRTYANALGDDLVVLPAPRMGDKARASNGGWGWAVPASSSRVDDIAVFLNFALSPEQVTQWSRITGYIPARTDVLAAMPEFAPDGALHIFAEQARTIYLVRPVHPAWPVISSEFGRAVANIYAGANINTTLNKAAREIDWDMEDNLGYPPFGQWPPPPNPPTP